MIWRLYFLTAILALIQQFHAIPFESPTCGYESCPDYDPEALNVHIVCHSHDDVGWLKTVEDYYKDDVRQIITSVVDALKENPKRRFVQVEIAYFALWWPEQNDQTKKDVIKLINNGQLEIIGGGWSMNDEGATHYQSTIDQFSHGFRYLEDNLGSCARPRVGWQIDPFGHSREQASISAQLGFDSLFFARADYRDLPLRKQEKRMDLLWRGSSNLGNSSDIFTSILYHHYSCPPGFCFDNKCSDEEINEYNQLDRVHNFADYVKKQAESYVTNNILVTMGDDFQFHDASKNYRNLDLLTEGFDKYPQTDNYGRPIKVFYSTPSCYTKAVNEYVNSHDQHFELKTDDFLPYADGQDTYWSGYYTSRPNSKRFERLGNNLLQVTKQLSTIAQLSYDNTDLYSLKSSMGVLQHHDAITGTEQQHVSDNYHWIHSKAIEKSLSLVNSVLSNLISKGSTNDLGLTSCLLSNVSYCPVTDSNEFTVVLYNPLSRPVSYPVSLPVPSQFYTITDPKGDTVKYQTNPPIRSFSYVTDAQPQAPNILEFIAEDIPPLGYKVYRFKETNEDDSIKLGFDGINGETRIEIDKETGLLSSVTMNGVTLNVSQDFLYYDSCPLSGAYIFTPINEHGINGTLRVADGTVKVTPIKGDIYQGVLQEFDDWAYQMIKVYNHDRSFVEFDWVIGPIDVDDGGKEVISQFKTNLQTDGLFYTDSNGRELLERKRNYRPTYQYTNSQPIAGNYYPINTKILLNDSDYEFAILTDRSQGGGSIYDGQVELMVHRAMTNDDGRGVGEALNEQQYGQGLVVRGQHYLVLGPKSTNGEKTVTAIERDLAQKILLRPWILLTNQNIPESLINLEWSALNSALPENVHLLTLEPWGENKVLLRLEHPFERSDDVNLSKSVIVNLRNLFTFFTIKEAKETSLGGNIPLNEFKRLHWPGSESCESNEGVHFDENDDLSITLNPMQIRTFILTVAYK